MLQTILQDDNGTKGGWHRFDCLPAACYALQAHKGSSLYVTATVAAECESAEALDMLQLRHEQLQEQHLPRSSGRGTYHVGCGGAAAVQSGRRREESRKKRVAMQVAAGLDRQAKGLHAAELPADPWDGLRLVGNLLR